LLLADEPTGNLDSTSSAEILTLFEQLNGQGITVVLVTHDPDVAAHAARVLTVRDGLIAGDAAPQHHVYAGATGASHGQPLRRVRLAHRSVLTPKRRII
jgi:putative ABC transport system ATP-binding protein